MIQIYTDEVNAQVRKIPVSEVLVDADPDENIIEIDLDEITLRMTEECAGPSPRVWGICV